MYFSNMYIIMTYLNILSYFNLTLSFLQISLCSFILPFLLIHNHPHLIKPKCSNPFKGKSIKLVSNYLMTSNCRSSVAVHDECLDLHQHQQAMGKILKPTKEDDQRQNLVLHISSQNNLCDYNFIYFSKISNTRKNLQQDKLKPPTSKMENLQKMVLFL